MERTEENLIKGLQQKLRTESYEAKRVEEQRTFRKDVKKAYAKVCDYFGVYDLESQLVYFGTMSTIGTVGVAWIAKIITM